MLPTACHRCDISLKGTVLPGRNDAEMGPANSLHASAHYSEYNERFDLKIERLVCTVCKVAKLMLRNSRKKLPNRLNRPFSSFRAMHKQTNNATRFTRLNLNCIYQDTNTKITKKFKYQQAKIWNLAPYEYKKLPFDQFKLKYKKYLSLNCK